MKVHYKVRVKPKLIAVIGPTATGKSSFAVSLAKKINGEIVSADSRQVYKGLDIGSGKITKKEMKGVKHHMLDVASPSRVYTVSDYKKDALEVIAEILAQHKTPILVGGSGFFVDAITKNIEFPEVGPNKKLRASLSKLSLKKLQEKLKKLDSKRYKEIDQKNPVRLIRAIEIATSLGKVPSVKSKPLFDVETIYLDFPDAELKKRIHKRLLARMKIGMVQEAKKLYSNGLSWKRMEQLGLEYRYLARYLQNKISEEEMLVQLEKEIWKYAKRQRTWFKRDL